MQTQVFVHVAGHGPVPATLSTDHPSSSYGQPVLLMDGGPSYPDGERVPHGPDDVTPHGVAALLVLEAAETDEDGPGEGPTALDRWNGLCAALRAQGRLPTMAQGWLGRGRWADGSEWRQGDRSLVDELDRAPLERAVVRHVVDQEEDAGVEGASWTFPDGSGIVEVGDVWDVFSPEGRTVSGWIVRPARGQAPTDVPLLRTRIPEARKVGGLEYGSHVTFPARGREGYHVRPEGTLRWGIAVLTPAGDELEPDDSGILASIEEELAGDGG